MNDRKSAYNELRNDLFCKFCGRQCKNLNSLNNHERLCKENPYHDSLSLPDHKGKNNPMYGKPAWNKGLTKETDLRVAKARLTYAKNENLGLHKKTKISKEANILRKQKLSNFAKYQNNFWQYRRKHLKEYNGVMFDSSYEIQVVSSLDENNVLWEKPSRFSYTDNSGVHHTYTPDIYLPEYDVYLDPKNDFLIENVNPNLGFKDTDKIKWVQEQNNIRVIIVDKNHLSWDKIKTLL